MDDATLLKIVVSFLAGGGTVVLVTLMAERFGSRLGGLLAGFPATLVVSLLFQGIVLGPGAAAAACGPALVSLSVFGALCIGYVRFYRSGFLSALGGGIAAWVAVIVPFILLDVQNFSICLPLFLVLAGLFKIVLGRMPVPVSAAPIQAGRPVWTYVVRFLTGGGIVSAAVVMAVLTGEVLGGVLSAFPAMACSSVIILHYTMGDDFAAAFLQNAFASAVVNCFVYITGVYVLYPVAGLLWGTLGAYACSMVSAYVLYRWQNRAAIRTRII